MTAIHLPRAAVAEHGGVDVAQDDPAVAAHLRQEGAGQIPGAAGQIQHLLARPHAGQRDGETFPDPVQPHRHQIVHEVVAAGHRIEYAAHPLLLVLAAHALEAEIGLVGAGADPGSWGRPHGSDLRT